MTFLIGVPAAREKSGLDGQLEETTDQIIEAEVLIEFQQTT